MSKTTKVVFASDFHIPDHDKRLCRLFARAVHDIRPHILILGGDVIDNYSVSKYDKDPERMTVLGRDLEVARGFLDKMVPLAPHVVYLEGNHEARLRKYLLRGAPQILTTKATSLQSLLGLSARNIQYIPYGSVYRIGPMGFTHGDKVAKWSGHSVKTMCMDMIQSLCIGHCHRQGVFYHTSGRRKILGIEAGTMADMKIARDYMDREPNWQQGFAYLEIGDSITWELPHYDGKRFGLCGKIYGGKDGVRKK